MNMYLCVCVCVCVRARARVYSQIYFLKMLLALECGYVYSCKHTGSSRIFKRVLVRSVHHVEIPAGKLTCDYTLLLFVKVDDETVHSCKWSV